MAGKSLFLFLTGAVVGAVVTDYLCSEKGRKMCNKVLKKKSFEFEKIDDELDDIMHEMAEKIHKLKQEMHEMSQRAAEKFEKSIPK